MSKTLPDQNTPVRLRASSELNLQNVQARTPGGAPASQPDAAAASLVHSGSEPSMSLVVPAFAATGLALLLGGWMLQRRQRLAPREVQRLDTMQSDERPAAAPRAGPPVDALAEFAAQPAEVAEPAPPTQVVPVPLERRQRYSQWMRVTNQKRLIKGLMWVRTVLGAAAILATIAIVVFWAIELTDMRAGDSGLTKPLLVLALAAWALSWAAGKLANRLHSAFFNRVHPKFDT